MSQDWHPPAKAVHRKVRERKTKENMRKRGRERRVAREVWEEGKEEQGSQDRVLPHTVLTFWADITPLPSSWGQPS